MQLMGATARIEKEIPSINWPFLLLHGDADKLCDIRGSMMMHKNAPSSDKKIKVGMVCPLEMLGCLTSIGSHHMVTNNHMRDKQEKTIATEMRGEGSEKREES